MSKTTAIRLATHTLYFIIAGVSLYKSADVGVFLIVYLVLILLDTLVRGLVINKLAAPDLGWGLCQNLLASILALFSFLVAGFLIGNSIPLVWLGYVIATLIFISFEQVYYFGLDCLARKIMKTKKRQVI